MNNNNLKHTIMQGFDQMSDRDIMEYAQQIGCEDFIVLDLEGGLANRKEVIDTIIECELRDCRWDETELDPAGGYGLYSHI